MQSRCSSFGCRTIGAKHPRVQHGERQHGWVSIDITNRHLHRTNRRVSLRRIVGSDGHTDDQRAHIKGGGMRQICAESDYPEQTLLGLHCSCKWFARLEDSMPAPSRRITRWQQRLAAATAAASSSNHCDSRPTITEASRLYSLKSGQSISPMFVGS